MANWVDAVLSILAIIPAIVLHEVSHGYVAYMLGDPTAKNAGRLSLNPVKHVDPFGTLLLPALLALAGGPVFGYAKPVPINPHYFKDYRRGMLLTGLAGPTTNLSLAVASGLLVRVIAVPLLNAAPAGTLGDVLFYVVSYLALFSFLNLVLMFFNLIPIPPFDGSRVIPVFLSDSQMRAYAQVERYGFVIIFALIFFGRGIVDGYFAYTVEPLFRIIVGAPLARALLGV